MAAANASQGMTGGLTAGGLAIVRMPGNAYDGETVRILDPAQPFTWRGRALGTVVAVQAGDGERLALLPDHLEAADRPRRRRARGGEPEQTGLF